MIKKISLSVLYVFTFVVAVAFGSFVVVKSFGLATNQNNTITIGSKTYNTEAEGLMLMEANSGRVISSHNADKKLPMASLTKIITAIVAIEKNKDLDTKLAIPKEAVGIEGSSIYLRAGEHLTIRELLYGLMLRSGNDAATAIAILTSGSVPAFMEECNNFCTNLGLTSTHLVTPSGLHDDDHYTTASDLAKITAYALKNKTFAEIVKTTTKTIPNELGKYDHRDLVNKNKFLAMVEGADGVKTGYTTKAGRCFVGSATREEDGLKIVCVLLNCRPMFQECRAFIQAALDSYKMHNLLDDGYESAININKSEQKSTMAKSEKGFAYPLTEDEVNKIEYHDTLSLSYDAPLSKHQKVGEIKVLLNNQLIFCDNIYTIEEVKDNTYKSSLDKVIDKFNSDL